MGTYCIICDHLWENRPSLCILYFEKYLFEILNALYFSCGTIQSRQISCINSVVTYIHSNHFVINSQAAYVLECCWVFRWLFSLYNIKG